MIAHVAQNRTAIPLFFPKVVPIFEFMDVGNKNFTPFNNYR